MTGREHSTRERFGAIFFAFIMVTSMVAVGIGGLAGSAAAVTNASSGSAGDLAGGGTQTVSWTQSDDLAAFELDYADGSFGSDGGSASSVTKSDISVSVGGSSVDIDDVTATSDDKVQVDLSTAQTGLTSASVSVDIGGIVVPDGSNNDYSVDIAVDDTDDDTYNGDVSQSGNSYTVFQSSNGDAPKITQVEKTGARELTVTFDEGVETSGGGKLVFGDFSITDNTGDGISPTATVSHDPGDEVAVVPVDADITSNNIGTDTVTTSTIIDIDSNSADDNREVVIKEPALAAGVSNGVQLEIRGEDSADDVAELLAGNASTSIGELRLRDDSTDGEAFFSGTTEITFPDGVTVNETASNLDPVQSVLTTQDLAVSDINVIDGGNTLELVHDGTRSTDGETIRINNIVLSVDGNAIDTTNHPDKLAIDVSSFGGTGTFSDVVQVKSTSPDATFGGPYAVNINNNGQTLSGNNLRIPAGQLTKSIEGNTGPAIANQSNIVLTLESGTGITWNADSASTITLDNNGDLNLDGSGDNELDPSQVTVTEQTVSIPVVDEISTGTNDFVVEGLEVDTNGSATKTDLNVSVTAPGSNAGSYVLESSGGATFTDYVNTINSPQITYDSSSDFVPAGSSGIPSNLDLDVSSGSITAGDTITIGTNVSGAEFTTEGDGDSQISVSDMTADNSFDDSKITNAEINSNGEIVLTTDAAAGDLNTGQLVLSDDSTLDLKIPSSAADEADLAFTMDVAGAVQVESSNLITIERPNAALNGGNNATVQVDQDGQQIQVDTGSSSGPSDGALFIESDDVNGQIADTTNLTVTLEEGTGVTFDKSVAVNAESAAKNEEFDIFTDDGSDDFAHNEVFDDDGETPADGTINAVTVSDNSIEIEFDDENGDGVDTSFASGEALAIDELFLNVSAGASNTTVSVTTNTSDENEVTTQLSEIIQVNQQEAATLRADANFGDGSADLGGSGVDRSISGSNAPQVDNTITSVVKAEDGISNFGGAEVDLEIVETPEGSSGASLNTTVVTTGSNGQAAFNFTAGDTVGDYVVNASLAGTTDSSASLNITYTASPGNIDGVSVTPVENAIAGGSNELGTASMFVNATDSNGNPVSKSATVSVTADNVGASGVEAFDNLASDGTGDTSADSLDDGQFSLDSDGSSVIEVTSSQVEDVTITAEVSGNSDTGTVTFFDQVGGIDLTLNESSVATGSTVSADATLTQEDGTVIEVPDVTVNYDDNSDGNTTFDGDADAVSATTNGSGVASVNVTAEQNGTSTIDATSNLRSASATLTIGGQADTGSPLDGTAGEYDSNGDGQVTATELGSASTAFAQGDLTASELGDVAVAFANS